MSVALHAEATPDPQVVRWRFTDIDGPPQGRVDPLPPELVRAGVGDIVADAGGLVVRLRDGLTWAQAGVSVRDALADALSAGQWNVEPFEQPGEPRPDDDAIAVAVRDVLDGDVGTLARSHGGAIELVEVRDGVVVVRLAGACHGCPASAMTLHRVLETQVRGRVPGVVEVRSHEPERTHRRLGPAGRRLLDWADDSNRLSNDRPDRHRG